MNLDRMSPARDPTGFCLVEEKEDSQLKYIFSNIYIYSYENQLSMSKFESLGFAPFIGEQTKLKLNY